MNREDLINATTINDIIQQKLAGMVNKIDIASDSKEDDRLKKEVRAILKLQQDLAKALKEKREKS